MRPSYILGLVLPAKVGFPRQMQKQKNFSEQFPHPDTQKSYIAQDVLKISYLGTGEMA